MYKFDNVLTLTILESEDRRPSIDENNEETYNVKLDQIQAAIFCNFLTNNETFRKSAVAYWTAGRTKPTVLIIYIGQLTTSVLDYGGCSMSSILLWNRIEQEDALHWLSTLGGAFSNLGESRPEFAVKAGRNAGKQMLVGLSSGDASLVARCQLFIAHSQIQLGNLKAAGKMVKAVWRFCHSPPLVNLAISNKLANMCQGIWARLKFERKRASDSDREIEMKFVVPDDYATVLESVHAILVSEILLEDTYFDTDHFDLLKRDIWLRKRGDDWELKIPLGDNLMGGFTQYREVVGLEKISNELKNAINKRPNELDVLVQFSSTRENWKLEKFNIVIDRIVEDGWTVGEIELMNNSSENVMDSKKRIEDLGRKLGFEAQTFGKVQHCLATQKPEAWKILLELSNNS